MVALTEVVMRDLITAMAAITVAVVGAGGATLAALINRRSSRTDAVVAKINAAVNDVDAGEPSLRQLAASHTEQIRHLVSLAASHTEQIEELRTMTCQILDAVTRP